MSQLKQTNLGGLTGKTATLYHDRRMVESYRTAKTRQFRAFDSPPKPLLEVVA